MSMLTTRARVSELLQVAIGMSDRDFNRYLREAQEFDLKELITDEFYHDLINNASVTKYKKLIDGGTYNFEDRDYTFSGIDKALAYFSYGRMMMFANVVSTSHGIVVKKTSDSTPLAIEERKNFYYSHKKNGNRIFEEVKKYIERFEADYPSWNLEACKKKENYSLKTSVIQ